MIIIKFKFVKNMVLVMELASALEILINCFNWYFIINYYFKMVQEQVMVLAMEQVMVKTMVIVMDKIRIEIVVIILVKVKEN